MIVNVPFCTKCLRFKTANGSGICVRCLDEVEGKKREWRGGGKHRKTGWKTQRKTRPAD